MLLHMAPRNWIFIFLALLLSCYIKLAAAKNQPSMNPLVKLAKLTWLL